MQRYVVVDADGYAVNVVLWDGETPFHADGELVLESECKAKLRPVPEDAVVDVAFDGEREVFVVRQIGDPETAE